MGIVNKHALWEDTIFGLAVAPQSVASAATVNGVTIAAPWKKGRMISFLFLGGVFGATTAAIIKIQKQKISDSTWVDETRPDGTTVLRIPAARSNDASVLEAGALMGTLDMGPIDSDTYKAIRVTIVENGGGANTMLLGVGYLIHDLYTHPSGMVDELFALQRYAP